VQFSRIVENKTPSTVNPEILVKNLYRRRGILLCAVGHFWAIWYSNPLWDSTWHTTRPDCCCNLRTISLKH